MANNTFSEGAKSIEKPQTPAIVFGYAHCIHYCVTNFQLNRTLFLMKLVRCAITQTRKNIVRIRNTIWTHLFQQQQKRSRHSAVIIEHWHRMHLKNNENYTVFVCCCLIYLQMFDNADIIAMVVETYQQFCFQRKGQKKLVKSKCKLSAKLLLRVMRFHSFHALLWPLQFVCPQSFSNEI